MNTQEDINQAISQTPETKSQSRPKRYIQYVIKVFERSRSRKHKKCFYAVYCDPSYNAYSEVYNDHRLLRWKGPCRRYKYQAKKDGQNFLKRKCSF